MKNPFRARTRQAFTLIELLTVIGIIAILAAIIIPAVSNSRERGRRAFCQNNLSQIGRGLMMYTDEKGDAFPVVSTTVTESYWDRAVLPYIGDATNILICPSDPLLSGATSRGAPRTYAVNAVPQGWSAAYRVPFGRYGVPTSALRTSDLEFSKGDTILVGERVGLSVDNRGYFGWFNFCGLDFTRGSLHSRKGANYLMSSMSVKYMETNNAAFSIAEGNKGNPWTVYTGN